MPSEEAMIHAYRESETPEQKSAREAMIAAFTQKLDVLAAQIPQASGANHELVAGRLFTQLKQ